MDTAAGPLKTTVLLLEDNEDQICLVASDVRVDMGNVSRFLREKAAAVLGIDQSKILLVWSHNHSVARLAREEIRDYEWYENTIEDMPEVELLPFGERFLDSLIRHLRELPGSLEPADVLWSQGVEGRITYNGKGRRADGSTYFMREEDRGVVCKDYNGDIDREVPVVVFRGQTGKPIAALLQFAGHPVTSYHPERAVIFGDYPTVASDVLGHALGGQGQPVPVAFLQGCAADVYSKEMFVGGVSRARQFGEWLGQSAVDALTDLTSSGQDGMDYAAQTVHLPLEPLPARETILAGLAEIKDFLRRAEAGDEDTLSCIGLNFPRALSPEYRGALVAAPLRWHEWALDLYAQGRENTVMRSLDVTVHVLRLGDVAVIGMPFEPFLGIGRQMRARSPYPLTIPCGYTNITHGNIPDSSNAEDREFISAFHLYTRFRPPLARPAGDVVADRAVEILAGFHENTHG